MYSDRGVGTPYKEIKGFAFYGLARVTALAGAVRLKG